MMNDIVPKILITVRIVLFLAGLGAGVIILFAGTRAALAAGLRDIAVVTGDRITVGDIFDGARDNADYVLGPAPQPGKDMVLDARTLYRIAAALKLDWKPQSSADSIVVRRAATVIPVTQIEDVLKSALEKQPGLDDKFTMTMMNSLDPMVLPQGEDASVEVAALSYDATRSMFDATLVAPSKDNPLKKIHLTGQIERIMAIPVLKNSLRNGDLINAHDLDWVDVPVRNVQHDMLVNEKDVLGMTPRRIIAAGRPMIVNDLQQPVLVSRGDEVTISFANGPIQLSTKGRAMQNGARGDSVRVTNINSNKSFDAFVTGSREVTVR